jgi:hypothetical protein
VRVTVGLLLALGLAVVACDSTERREAQTVIHAVERFRSADNTTTPAAVVALKATRCSVPEVCQTRDACVSAGEATAEALRLKRDVEKALDALDKGTLAKDSPESQLLPKKLDDAEVFLKKGHQGLAACDEHVVTLKHRHRI